MSRGMGMSRRGGYPSRLDIGPGIPWDMVGKRAVHILLECFLVPDCFRQFLSLRGSPHQRKCKCHRKPE